MVWLEIEDLRRYPAVCKFQANTFLPVPEILNLAVKLHLE